MASRPRARPSASPPCSSPADSTGSGSAPSRPRAHSDEAGTASERLRLGREVPRGATRRRPLAAKAWYVCRHAMNSRRNDRLERDHRSLRGGRWATHQGPPACCLIDVDAAQPRPVRLPQRRRARLLKAWNTNGRCLHRGVQRPHPGRMPQRKLVPVAGGRPRSHRSLEDRLQHRTTALDLGSLDAQGLRSPSSRRLKGRMVTGPESGARPDRQDARPKGGDEIRAIRLQKLQPIILQKFREVMSEGWECGVKMTGVAKGLQLILSWKRSN
jgi:hypothetical protein